MDTRVGGEINDELDQRERDTLQKFDTILTTHLLTISLPLIHMIHMHIPHISIPTLLQVHHLGTNELQNMIIMPLGMRSPT